MLPGQLFGTHRETGKGENTPASEKAQSEEGQEEDDLTDR